MKDVQELFGICGVYCGMCVASKEILTVTATKLKELIVEDYQWVESLENNLDFKYKNFLKGLDWFSKQQCPTCNKISDHWCEVRKCSKIINNEIKSCLLCEEFLTCERTTYQRDHYPFVIEHHERVKVIGFDKHLEEEEKRAQEGITLQKIRKY